MGEEFMAENEDDIGLISHVEHVNILITFSCFPLIVLQGSYQASQLSEVAATAPWCSCPTWGGRLSERHQGDKQGHGACDDKF